MSIQAVAWALEQDLPARPKLVLVSIANHADHTNGYCWLKAETIAAEAACTPRSVYRFIGGLARNGYLRKSPRKGHDGKQRANDYWLLLDRPDADWDWGKEADDEEVAAEADSDHAPAQAPDVDEPHDTASHGDAVENAAADPVDKHAVSPGPSDSRVRRLVDEPSKTKPKEGEASASFRATPRSYHPPPPETPSPMGAIAGPQAKQIFVFVGTDAWESWGRYREHVEKRGGGYPTTQANIDGKLRTGWYFPSLYPPSVAQRMAGAPSRETTGPPKAR